jgi:hypothetical protein
MLLCDEEERRRCRGVGEESVGKFEGGMPGTGDFHVGMTARRLVLS